MPQDAGTAARNTIRFSCGSVLVGSVPAVPVRFPGFLLFGCLILFNLNICFIYFMFICNFAVNKLPLPEK